MVVIIPVAIAVDVAVVVVAEFVVGVSVVVVVAGTDLAAVVVALAVHTGLGFRGDPFVERKDPVRRMDLRNSTRRLL